VAGEGVCATETDKASGVTMAVTARVGTRTLQMLVPTKLLKNNYWGVESLEEGSWYRETSTLGACP